MTHTIYPRLVPLFMVAAIIAFSADAKGSGATGHIVASALAIEKIADPKLRDILTRHRSAFFNGSLFPDAILKHLQAGSSLELADADKASHGRQQSPAHNPGGLAAYAWSGYWKLCPTGPSTITCEERLAFYMGIIAHMAEDSPWHGHYLDNTDHCEPCQTSVGVASGGWKYCHPGGEGVARDPTHKVSGNTQHQVLDNDIDLCLAAALEGRRIDISPVPQNPMLFAPGSKTSAKSSVALCPVGSFYDPIKGGQCWSCPSGTNRTAYAVTANNACSRGAYEEFQSATKLKSLKVGEVCTSGFHDFKGGDSILGACWSCGGYNRTAYPVDDAKACAKWIPEKLMSATFVKQANLGNCPDGQALGTDGGCYRCPTGYNDMIPVNGMCGKKSVLECSRLTSKLPAIDKLGLPPVDPELYAMLSSALKSDGHDVDVAQIVKQVGLFNTLPWGQSKPTLASGLVSPAGPLCGKAIANAVTGRGALQDSAAEAAKLINALWKHRAEHSKVYVIRTDTYEYQVVKTGQTLHRTWNKNCSADKDDRRCIDDPTVPGKTSSVREFNPTLQRNEEVVAFYNPARKKFLRFQPGSDCATVDSSASDVPKLPLSWDAERFEVVVANGPDDKNERIYAFASISPKKCFLRMTNKGVIDSAGGAGELPDEWTWERFMLISAGDGLVGLWSPRHLRYVQVNKDGTVGASDVVKVSNGIPKPTADSQKLQILWP